MLETLNTEQLRCVKHFNGPLLVLAGPGSGKTKTITTRIAYLIDFHKVLPEEIVAITFTNKAAAEMRQRVKELVDENSSRRIQISTFHAFCVRILRIYGEKLKYRKNFVIFDDDDSKRLIKEIISEYNISGIQHDILYSIISNAKNSNYDPKEYAKMFSHDKNIGDISLAFEQYNLKLLENNAMDFNDLINNVIKLLKCHSDVASAIANKYKYIHVDEYQDTNNAQYELIKMLAGTNSNIVAVGDPDQSIYGWRGANFQNIEKFRKDYRKNLVEVQLIVNYRSTNSIIRAAEELIKHNAKHKKKKMESTSLKDYQIEYRNLFNEQQEASFVSTMIKQLVQNDPDLEYSDFAVLYRNNELSRTVEESLIGNKIPYKVKAGISFYQRREIRDMLAYMSIVEDPNSNYHFKRVINIPKRGIGQKTIEKLEYAAQQSKKSLFETLSEIENQSDFTAALKNKLRDFYNLVNELQSFYKNTNDIIKLYDKIIEKIGYYDYINATEKEEAENKIRNVNEFRSAIVVYTEETPDPSLSNFLEHQTLGQEVTVEETQNCVNLSTLHAAKGLEFKVVFLIALEEDIFPSYRSAQESNIDEERRLMYVGITRAKERLFVSSVIDRLLYGRRKRYNQSRFISESFIDKNKKTNSTEINYNVDFVEGEKILHDRFGTGIILEIEDLGENSKMKINFETSGIKTILKNHSAIHKL
jgi:DNA helicase-2/ATP-dependent DNA helicase PcrA